MTRTHRRFPAQRDLTVLTLLSSASDRVGAVRKRVGRFLVRMTPRLTLMLAGAFSRKRWRAIGLAPVHRPWLLLCVCVIASSCRSTGSGGLAASGPAVRTVPGDRDASQGDLRPHAQPGDPSVLEAEVSCFLSGADSMRLDAEAPGNIPDFLRDRGPGVPTSLFDIYVARHELDVVPFFAYLDNQGFQYSPDELGVPGEETYRAKVRTEQGVLFLAYGVSDSVSVGLTVAAGGATFHKSSADPTAVPATIDESGLSELRPEVTWRFLTETERRPELFAFMTVGLPHSKDKYLVGLDGWLLKPGLGVAKGFSWGTLVARFGFEYDTSSASPLDFGAWMVEAQRRFSPKWWASAGFEGVTGGPYNLDEVYLTGEVVWEPKPGFGVRLRPQLGLTRYTKGWGIEVGFVFRLGRSRHGNR